jgi:hypothetical protein
LDLALVSRFQALVDLSGSEVVMTSGIPILSIDSVLPAKLAKLVD